MSSTVEECALFFSILTVRQIKKRKSAFLRKKIEFNYLLPIWTVKDWRKIQINGEVYLLFVSEERWRQSEIRFHRPPVVEFQLHFVSNRASPPCVRGVREAKPKTNFLSPRLEILLIFNSAIHGGANDKKVSCQPRERKPQYRVGGRIWAPNDYLAQAPKVAPILWGWCYSSSGRRGGWSFFSRARFPIDLERKLPLKVLSTMVEKAIREKQRNRKGLEFRAEPTDCILRSRGLEIDFR